MYSMSERLQIMCASYYEFRYRF